MVRFFLFLAAITAGSCRAATLRASVPTIPLQSHRKLSNHQGSFRVSPFVTLMGDTASVLTSTVHATPNTTVPSTNNIHRELQSVTGALQLINADTDRPIVTLEDGMVIALDAIPNMTTPSLNINADFNRTDVSSVRFGYNTTVNFRTDTVAPFAFCGNVGPNFYKCNRLGLGAHTITATPRYKNGKLGRSVTLTFTVILSDTTSPKLLNLVALTPTTVDVTNGAAEIIFQVTAQDDASGFGSGFLGFRGRGPQDNDFVTLFGPKVDFTPVPSINAKNNDPVTFNVSVRVPPYLRNDTYDFSLDLTDQMFNYEGGSFSSDRLNESGFVSTITVLNSGLVDATDPELISFVATSPLNITHNSNVSFVVTIQDNLSGIDYGSVDAIFINGTDYFWVYTEFGKPGKLPVGRSAFANNNPALPAGVPHSFAIDLVFGPNLPRGDYELYFSFADGVRNATNFNPEQLLERGLPSMITLS